MGNQNITWERAKKYDVGMELGFFRDRLFITADWFKEDRNNILTTLGTIPAIYGVPGNSVPPANVGITRIEVMRFRSDGKIMLEAELLYRRKHKLFT